MFGTHHPRPTPLVKSHIHYDCRDRRCTLPPKSSQGLTSRSSLSSNAASVLADGREHGGRRRSSLGELLAKLSTSTSVPYYSTLYIDGDGLGSPQVSTNKEGQYCYKKYSSPSTHLCSRFCILCNSLQPVLWAGETSWKSPHHCQVGQPKVVPLCHGY